MPRPMKSAYKRIGLDNDFHFASKEGNTKNAIKFRKIVKFSRKIMQKIAQKFFPRQAEGKGEVERKEREKVVSCIILWANYRSQVLSIRSLVYFF